jgi:hypothetical protein
VTDDFEALDCDCILGCLGRLRIAKALERALKLRARPGVLQALDLTACGR